jgi:nucleoside-diphosphate-sugar epimerase
MDLVIGNSSQLFQYFKEYKENILGISSRNIDFDQIRNNRYDNVFLAFAEQRTFLNEDVEFFNKTNVEYTLNIINNIKYNSKKIVVYLTSELWNQYEGGIDISMPFIHNNTPYIKSKEILKKEIDIIREKEGINIQIIYPFNFSSPYRKEGFLFSKMLDVILNKNKITVGDLNFYRDIITPRIVVNNSYEVDNDVIVGSGVLVNMREFYSDLLGNFNIDYNEYITENKDIHINTREPYYLKTENKYKYLLTDTIYDIKKYISSIS